MGKSASPRIELLIRILEEAYGRKAWHGTTLRGSLRGLSVAVAKRRPAPGRHNIAELTLHAAYWKYTVRRRLRGEKRGSFALEGSNWFPAEASFGETEWRNGIRILQQEHDALRETIEGIDEAALDRKPPNGGIWTVGQLISGVASHDLYHAGQIQLVKRLVE